MAEKPKHDAPVIFALMGFVLFLLSTLLWLMLSVPISNGLRWIRIGELKLASLFNDKYDGFIEPLSRLAPEQITPWDLLVVSQAATEVLHIPITFLMGAAATFLFFRKPKHSFVRKLNLEKLAKEQATAFPVTTPIIKFNPLAAGSRIIGSPVPDKLPPFTEALTPEEWIAHSAVPMHDGTVDRDFARLAFAKQLGGRWKGVDALPWYGKALFAAFAMKAAGQRVESDEFLGKIAQCWVPGRGLDLSRDLRAQIVAKIRDPKVGRILEKVAGQHAFVAPAMLRCLMMAREQGGVLAPAQFLWLRAVDRALWYPLNNLGRGSVHPEAAGAIAHFKSEKAADKPIPNPQVDVAIDGLQKYLGMLDKISIPVKEYA